MAQQPRSYLIGWSTGCVFAIASLAGCQLVRTPGQLAVFAHELRREQIVLHSDFSFEQHQQLIDELCSQRQLLSNKLRLPLTDVPIHIYLFADSANYYDLLALRFPSFPSRRAIFVETDTELAVYAHWGDHTAEDLRHEVTHGYLHAALPRLPLWLDEGLAEYFEVGTGVNGVNQTHIGYLASQTEWQPNLLRLEQLAIAADMTQQDYAESWAWVHFLLESTPRSSHLLTDYLADLQQGKSGSLAELLNAQLASAEGALAEHLQALSK